MNDTFMKEKPILPLLTSMALPMVISMLVNSLYNIVDSFFVAQINEQAMAALSLVFPVQNFVNATAIGFGVGINAMIAFHLGAGNKGNANASATHGMILSVIHGFLALIISIAIMPTFLGAFTGKKLEYCHFLVNVQSKSNTNIVSFNTYSLKKFQTFVIFGSTISSLDNKALIFESII